MAHHPVVVFLANFSVMLKRSVHVPKIIKQHAYPGKIGCNAVKYVWPCEANYMTISLPSLGCATKPAAKVLHKICGYLKNTQIPGANVKAVL